VLTGEFVAQVFLHTIDAETADLASGDKQLGCTL